MKLRSGKETEESTRPKKKIAKHKTSIVKKPISTKKTTTKPLLLPDRPFLDGEEEAILANRLEIIQIHPVPEKSSKSHIEASKKLVALAKVKNMTFFQRGRIEYVVHPQFHLEYTKRKDSLSYPTNHGDTIRHPLKASQKFARIILM